MFRNKCFIILAVLSLILPTLSVSTVAAANYRDTETSEADSVSDFGCYDKHGSQVNHIFGSDEITVRATVRSTSDIAHEVMLAEVLYKDGIIEDFQIKNKVVDGEEETITCELTLPETIGDDMCLKAFVWDVTDGNMKPMAKAICLTPSEIIELFVSNDGDDSAGGTKQHPYATLEKAQETVRCFNKNMKADINVYIAPGVYQLSNTWRLTDEDSGSNGYRVNYIASGDVIVSGGERVGGWENVSGNLYRAHYSGDSLVNELYVNGVKAIRAAEDGKVTPLGFYYDGEGSLKGIRADAKYADYKNPGDMQLHYAIGWKAYVLNVEDIIEGNGESIFIMGDGFVKATTPGDHSVKADSRFYLENVFECLDSPGEFYYDSTNGYIYYMTDGTDVLEAYVPVLEQLVNIEGADSNNKAENITFDGITFAHATWNYTAENDFIGGQSQSFAGMTKKKTALDNLGVTVVDAGVQINRARNIEMINGAFAGIAKVAVGLYNGAENVRIEGNAFYDIGDSAVMVGLPSDDYLEKDYEGCNLAFNKVCTSSNKAEANPAYNAVNGSAKEGWSAETVNGSYANAWWQVDLGAEYEIDRIEIDARKGTNQFTTRRLFEVLASSYEDFRDGGTRLAAVSETGFENEGTWRSDVTDSNKYRYVRVRKTANEYMYLAEIRVINLSMQHTFHKETCKNNKIYNNCITAIGQRNYGAPGIQTYYTDGTDIAHNYIYDIPYTGIAMGWGWTNTPDSTTSKNNKIRDNLIDNFALIMMDGGGIYTLGQQPESVISGNYIKNQNNVYGAVYSDNGSAEYKVSGNVMENVWLSMFVSDKTKKNLFFENNWATTNVSEMLGDNCQEKNTQYFIMGNMPEEAQSIADNAGLEDEYKSIVSKINVIPRVYTEEERLDNVMGEVSGHMTDSKLLKYCLKNIIDGARLTYQLAAENGGYGAEELAGLNRAINEANTEYGRLSMEIYLATAGGAAATDKIINRQRIFDAKADLDDAVYKLVQSKTE